MQLDELQGIVTAYLDGQLDSAQQRALSAELASSESSRREFWKRVQHEALLAQLVQEASGEADARPMPGADRIVAALAERRLRLDSWRSGKNASIALGPHRDPLFGRNGRLHNPGILCRAAAP